MEENSMQTSDPNKENSTGGLQWIQYHYLQKNNILHSNKKVCLSERANYPSSTFLKCIPEGMLWRATLVSVNEAN